METANATSWFETSVHATRDHASSGRAGQWYNRPGTVEPTGDCSVDEAPLEDLFTRLRAGDPAATDELLTLVYGQLRRLARRQLGGAFDSLGCTGLVNEIYLKLFKGGGGDWNNRAHFLGTAAKAMRQVVVDHARRSRARKRCAAGERVPLDELLDRYERNGADPVAIDEALERLNLQDPQLVSIVEMRFFVGYSVADTARILGTSPSTVARGWQVARAWLRRDLDGG
ncbi:MAG: ECF-type sigma factor [Planctomycetota bacterium]